MAWDRRPSAEKRTRVADKAEHAMALMVSNRDLDHNYSCRSALRSASTAIGANGVQLMNTCTVLSDQQQLPQRQLDYFAYQMGDSNLEYWRRIGQVDFKDKTILDLGCGYGALSIHAARQGAKRVLGVDIEEHSIDVARKILDTKFPEYTDVIEFACKDLASVREEFDIALSKDAFEHIDDLPEMMRTISAQLKEGGLLVTGFGPLYFSPYGDHGRYLGGYRSIPWAPALLPERMLFALASRLNDAEIQSAGDVGLNKLTPKQFRKIVADQGWTPISIEYNRGGRRGMQLLRLLRRIPLLEKYFTVSIYTQLRAPRKSPG
jgi:SAM-dependent methyltransferase